jgi:hypothetical protein
MFQVLLIANHTDVRTTSRPGFMGEQAAVEASVSPGMQLRDCVATHGNLRRARLPDMNFQG